jgi:hypothetical protein
MKPCKHLNYTDGAYEDCEIKTLAPHYPQVRFWRRGERWTDGGNNPSDVQFCGQGRGRINGIFQCYNEGEMPCYEPEIDK